MIRVDKMKTLPMNHGKAKMQVVGDDAVQCKRYIGKFTNPNLQAKADTGCWYTLIQGNPHAIEGEGFTPEAAIADSIRRTNSRMKQMQNAVETLEKVIQIKTSTSDEGYE